MRRRRAGLQAKGPALVVGFTLLLLLLVVHPVRFAEAGPRVPEGAVEAVAAEVVGPGAVRIAYVTSRGQVILRWESSAYDPSGDAGRARAALESEASRVTGELLAAFPVISAIHFTISHRGAVLATGEHFRGRPVVIFFSSRLAP